MSASAQTAAVTVVGGGIAGLAAALALAPNVPVRVLERRASAATNEGAGIQLSPNAMKALVAIGAADAVAKAAHRPCGLSIRSGRTEVVRVPYDTMEVRFGAPSFVLARAALHDALLTAAARHGNIEVVADAGVSRVAGDANGWRIDNGTVAPFLVAADGVSSTVRTIVAGDAPHETGWIAWRAMTAGGAPDTVLSMVGGAHLVTYAAPTDAQANVVYIAPERARPPTSPVGPLAPLLRSASGFSPWPVKVRQRHLWTLRRLAFVGDASHAMRPYLAQGAAMALEDAAVLGAAVAQHGPTEAALNVYRKWRAPRVRRVADQSFRQGMIYHLAAPLSFARNVAMARTGASGILDRLEWLYGWTPDVAND